MHFSLSITTLFSLVIAFAGQASTQPTQAEPQEQLAHLPFCQQHLS